MSISNASSPRPRRRARYTLGTLAGLAAAICLLSLPGALAAWLALAALAFAGACSIAWFGAIDEVAQRAHYEAWFRGGALGLTAVAVFGLYALITGAHWGFVQELLHHIGGDADASVAFSFGLASAFIAAVFGYAVWWALFWLRKR